jgi:hypothetical protein
LAVHLERSEAFIVAAAIAVCLCAQQYRAVIIDGTHQHEPSVHMAARRRCTGPCCTLRDANTEAPKQGLVFSTYQAAASSNQAPIYCKCITRQQLVPQRDNKCPDQSLQHATTSFRGVWFALLKFNMYCSIFVLFSN